MDTNNPETQQETGATLNQQGNDSELDLSENQNSLEQWGFSNLKFLRILHIKNRIKYSRKKHSNCNYTLGLHALILNYDADCLNLKKP